MWKSLSKFCYPPCDYGCAFRSHLLRQSIMTENYCESYFICMFIIRHLYFFCLRIVLGVHKALLSQEALAPVWEPLRSQGWGQEFKCRLGQVDHIKQAEKAEQKKCGFFDFFFLKHKTLCHSLLLSQIWQRWEYGEMGLCKDGLWHPHKGRWHLVLSLDLREDQRMVGTTPNLKHMSCLKGATVA